jgi:hypothetical protein
MNKIFNAIYLLAIATGISPSITLGHEAPKPESHQMFLPRASLQSTALIIAFDESGKIDNNNGPYQKTANKSSNNSGVSNTKILAYLECSTILEMIAALAESDRDLAGAATQRRMSGYLVDLAKESSKKGELTTERISLKRDKVFQEAEDTSKNGKDIRVWIRTKGADCIRLITEDTVVRPYMEERMKSANPPK